MTRVIPILIAGLGALAFAEDALPARDEITLLRRQLDQQQNQIEQLRKQVEEQQRLLDRLLPKLASAAPSSLPAPVAPPPAAAALVDTEGKPIAPLSFRIGAADFAPGGFLDFTSVFRSTNVGSGIGTSFGSIPFKDSPAGRLRESRFSAQNSRISLKVSSHPGRQRVTGYLEADFLGALPSNGMVTSNSNSLRMRLYWANVERGKWEFLGGQSWSLLTPNRKGLSPVPSDIFFSQDMDTNYQVGLTWARDPQFRVLYHANKNWTAGVSLENPEQYSGGSVALPSSFYATQLDTGGNPSTPNPHPDIIGKVAFDGRVGARAMHVEAAGLARGFRTAHPQGGTSTVRGFGGSVNADLELATNFHFIANTYYSQGGGRYLFGLGPDLILRPDGSLSPVHSMSALGGFEYQATPTSLWYGYYGGAYFRRNYSLQAPGQYVGFGFPGSPANANRQIQEATLGLIRTFWKRPNYGALQLITQYSYLTRSPWSSAPQPAHTHMVFTDLRYVLP